VLGLQAWATSTWLLQLSEENLLYPHFIDKEFCWGTKRSNNPIYLAINGRPRMQIQRIWLWKGFVPLWSHC
jgi:hypothetical protein